jgi:hypothetical protein
MSLVLTQLTGEWRMMVDVSSCAGVEEEKQKSTGSTKTDYPLARTLTGTWMGNTWVPPTPWWRLYSVEDMQDVYRDRTVLWIGDSTARRTGMVHFSILNQPLLNATTTPANNDTTTTSTTSSSWSPPLVSSPVHISAKHMERDIDLHKFSHGDDCPKWKNYTYTTSSNSNSNSNAVAVPGAAAAAANKTYANIFVCQPVPHGEVASMPVHCVAELRDVLRVTLREQQLQEQQLQEQQQRRQQLGEPPGGDDGVYGGVDGQVLAPIPIPSYDIIVIAIGIWQDVRPWDCRLPPNETITTLIQDSMRLLTKIITLDRRRRRRRRRRDSASDNNNGNNDDMRVIWRTGGWKHGMEQEKHLATLEMNQAIMDFIDAAHREYDQGKHNDDVGDDDDDNDDDDDSLSGKSARFMSYVNWGDAVAPRSFDERIHGDIKVHYGLEPRQMLVQMVTNQLVHMNAYDDFDQSSSAAA